MKKFGTPIGAAPGCASEKVGLSSVGVPSAARPRTLVVRLLLGPALELRDELLAVEVAGLELAGCAVGCALESAGREPPWLRFGAPGLLVAVGGRRGVRLRLGAGIGRARRVTVGSGGPRRRRRRRDRAVVDDLRDRARDAGDRDLARPACRAAHRRSCDALARHEDDGDGVQLGRGWERGDAEADRGHDHRDDQPSVFSFRVRVPPRVATHLSERFDAAGATLPRGPGTSVTLLSGLRSCN